MGEMGNTLRGNEYTSLVVIPPCLWSILESRFFSVAQRGGDEQQTEAHRELYPSFSLHTVLTR